MLEVTKLTKGRDLVERIESDPELAAKVEDEVAGKLLLELGCRPYSDRYYGVQGDDGKLRLVKEER